MIIYVIPCAAAKQAAPAKARDMYTSANFKLALAGAQAIAADTIAECGQDAKVMILSAYYGLLELDEVIEPYDIKMGDKGCIDTPSLAAQIADEYFIDPTTEFFAMLPKAYFDALHQAASTDTYMAVHPVFEAAPGIGYQRGVAAQFVREAA